MTTQYDISRYNMINYIKTWEVDDNTILDLIDISNTLSDFFISKDCNILPIILGSKET